EIAPLPDGAEILGGTQSRAGAVLAPFVAREALVWKQPPRLLKHRTRQEACDRVAEGREAVIALGPQAVHDETEALARFALSAPLHIAAGGAETGRPGQRQNV